MQHGSLRYLVITSPLLLGALASSSEAQTLYGYRANNEIVEFSGPSGLCGYPNGPVLGAFNASQTFTCDTPDLLNNPTGGEGDVAYDSIGERIFVADGWVIAEFSRDGTPQKSLQIGAYSVSYLPNPFVGLGMDASNNRVWATDGTMAQGFFGPGGCAAAGFSLGLPITVPTPNGGFATDIAVDPATDTLWACDDMGDVTNFAKDGTFISSFSLVPNLDGIAIDTATSGRMYLTDGILIYNVDLTGAFAFPTFYTTTPVYGVPEAEPLVGLAFAAHPVTYGAGSHAGGGTVPKLGSSGGTAIVANSTFEFTVSDMTAGTSAFIFLGAGALCPSLPILGLDVLISLSPAILQGSGVADSLGVATIPAPLPADSGGKRAFVQAVTIDGAFLAATEGMHFTVATP